MAISAKEDRAMTKHFAFAVPLWIAVAAISFGCADDSRNWLEPSSSSGGPGGSSSGDPGDDGGDDDGGGGPDDGGGDDGGGDDGGSGDDGGTGDDGGGDDGGGDDGGSDDGGTGDDDGGAGAAWSFIAVADSRAASDTSSQDGVAVGHLTAIVNKSVELNPDVVLFPGDLSNYGETKELQRWVQVFQPVYDAGILVYVVPGNHERSESAYQSLIIDGPQPQPKNGPNGTGRTHYAEYENALFIGLEEHFGDMGWVQSTMTTYGADKDFIFVQQHGPVAPRDHSPASNAQGLVSAMKSAGALALFCGHDHMTDHALVDGVVHQFIVGGGGAPQYGKDGYDGGFNTQEVEPEIGEPRLGLVYFEIDGASATSTIYYSSNGSSWQTGTPQTY
jgi:hypothetical protein